MATIEQVEELKQKMREQRAEVIGAARQLTPEDALRVPVDAEGEEQWTALEQLAHLGEMERSYDAWVRAALAEDGADLEHPLAARRCPNRRGQRPNRGRLAANAGVGAGLHLWPDRRHRARSV